MVRSERQQPPAITLKLLIFSASGKVNVSQFASQFVSQILVDGTPTGAPRDRLNAGLLVVGEEGHGTFCFGSARNISAL
jgi:hypothetical protein